MILIFGSTGYMGSAIADECDRRGIPWFAGNRKDMTSQVSMLKPELVVGAAAFIPSPTVDECKNDMDRTIEGNVVWPSRLAENCKRWDVPLVHLSTGCIFDERHEYSEESRPTRGWNGYCGQYVGCKLLAERLVRLHDKHYILRLRLPFDEQDHARNYLSKLASFDRVFEHTNSLTHRGDFAKWALDLWDKKAAFGTYHCVNTGQLTAKWLTLGMEAKGIVMKNPQFVKSPDTTGACLSNAKLASAIGQIRSVHEAVAEAINNWKPAHV